jgi:hypothetical protein
MPRREAVTRRVAATSREQDFSPISQNGHGSLALSRDHIIKSKEIDHDSPPVGEHSRLRLETRS